MARTRLGRIMVDSTSYEEEYGIVFQVGYDCLYSYSVSDPSACGLSRDQRQHRAALGAVTEAATGQVISVGFPVHQGQWSTGLTYIAPTPSNFGMAELGRDVAQTMNLWVGGPYNVQGVFQSPVPLWVGGSPQYVGLDQVNVAFPTCVGVATATKESHYDAFMQFENNRTDNKLRLYLRFIVKPGDPDCQFDGRMKLVAAQTTTTLSSDLNPSNAGQPVTSSANVFEQEQVVFTQRGW